MKIFFREIGKNVRNTFVALSKLIAFGRDTKVFITFFPVSNKNIFFKILQMEEETIFLLQSKKKAVVAFSSLSKNEIM
jgi:hypothetical protein